MYIPKAYQEKDLHRIRAFLHQYPFANLVSQMNGHPWATPLPLQHKQDNAGSDLLHGHMAKRNPQWKALEEQELLAIFQGPDAYISSSWYEKESVPTWNYQAVQAYGHARLLEGEELVESLRELVDAHEEGEEEPVSIQGMSPELFETERHGLIAFEIVVERFEAAFKLSQDKSSKDRRRVIQELEKKEDAQAEEVAKEMRRNEERGTEPER